MFAQALLVYSQEEVATIDHSLSARSITNKTTNQKVWKKLKASVRQIRRLKLTLESHTGKNDET